MKKLNLLILFILSFFTLTAQKQLTLKDAVKGQWSYLYPEHLRDVAWLDDKNFVYVKDWTAIYEQNIKSDKEKLIFSLTKFNSSSSEKKFEKLPYLYGLHWIDRQTFYVVFNKKVYEINIKSNELLYFELPDSADNIHYNPQMKMVAYTIANNIWLQDKDGKITKITHEKNSHIVCGSNYVHRQEFGIDNGIFWSPNGRYIAFYRKDETMVADYPLVDYTTFPAKLKSIKYPMIGQTSEQVTLGVYDIETGKTVFMKTGMPKDHYLTSVTWDPSSEYIYIGILNRDQNHLKFNKYSRLDGKMIKTLFEETNPKYVEPLHPAYFLPKSKDKFVWISRRNGFYHLYLYNTDGRLLKQLTDGQWSVTKYYGFSPDEKYFYLQSTAESPIERHIYRVDASTLEMTKLTNDNGVHKAIFSPSFVYFMDTYSNTQIPNNQVIVRNDGKIKRTVLQANNPLAEYNLGQMKIGTIKAADGKTDLYYRLILPPDLDTNKKYPAIVYVYGGPHAQLILDNWLGNVSMWQFFMAQRGYIMLTVDNRGSYNRGFDFESVTFRHLGVEEMKDQLEGVKFLKSLPYVDSSLLGVHGWSFGGFMTTSLMTTYPDVFKVAVAGGPVIDWKYYEVMYGERYMDTPEQNPDGFKQTSVLNKVQNLKGKLLVIHGGVDPVVVPQNSMQLLLKAQEKGIDIDFYTFPNSEHNMYGDNRVVLMRKVTEYFDTYLKKQPVEGQNFKDY